MISGEEIMPATPQKLKLSFAKNAYSIFGGGRPGNGEEQRTDQKTELLEGKMHMTIGFFMCR